MWGGYKPNNIYNVDSYEAIKEIPDGSIDCIYVDVPYLLGRGGGNESELSKRAKKRNEELINSNITSGFDYSILDEFIRVSKKVNIFIWCSRLQLPEVMSFFIVQNDYHWELLTWCKTNPIPVTNNVWLFDIEYCLYFRERGVILNDGYEYKSKWFCSAVNKRDKEEFEHPTIKPLELVKRHLKHVTQPGDIVLDCFLGSGTTAVACKEIGRQYIGFEIDKKYFEIAQDRLNGISQKDKKKIEQGYRSIFDYLD